MQTFNPDPSGSPGAWSAQQIRARSRWRSIQKLIGDDQLVRCWRGSYSTPQASQLIRLTALQEAIGGQLIACHQTAASLHGFGVLDDGLLHVITPDSRSLRPRQGVVLHQWHPRTPMTRIEGFLVTSAADTAIDVSCSAQEIDQLAVLDAALRAATTRVELSESLERAKGRRGIRTVKHWIAFADAAAESPMESRTRFRALAAGLPAPELQIQVDVPGGSRWLDMGWRHKLVGLEYDGVEFHSGDGRLARDRRRHNEILRAGWTLVYATAPDIWRQPGPLIAQLRELIG